MNTIDNNKDWLSNTEYKVLLDLYNEFHNAFIYLPDYIKEAFYIRLYSSSK